MDGGAITSSSLNQHINSNNYTKNAFQEAILAIRDKIKSITNGNSSKQDKDTGYSLNHFIGNKSFIGLQEVDNIVEGGEDFQFKLGVLEIRKFVIEKVLPLISEVPLTELFKEIRKFGSEQSREVNDNLINDFFEFMNNGSDENSLE